MKTAIPHWEKPLAAAGLTSYRYPSGMGLISSQQTWVMIGARDHTDALSEANRSLSRKVASMDKLQIWDGEKYVSVLTTQQPAPLASTSLNSKERKAQRLLAHYATCERLAQYLANLSPIKHITETQTREKGIIFGYRIGDHLTFDGKKISVALWKAERNASNAATVQCNGEAYQGQPYRNDGDWLLFVCEIKQQIIKALGTLPPGFFVNSDPRGAALKIDNETPEGQLLIATVGLQRDAGGFGLLSPEINGDR